MSDRVREAFEAHFRMLPYYCDHEVELAWIAWQASRAAALKEAAQACDGEATIEGIAQRCAARIRALGAK
jgi:hypothetical protein